MNGNKGALRKDAEGTASGHLRVWAGSKGLVGTGRVKVGRKKRKQATVHKPVSANIVIGMCILGQECH